MTHPLQVHWTGLLATKDAAGAFAFADHFIEVWDGFVKDDAEFQAEFCRPLPYLVKLDGRVQLKARYDTARIGGFIVWCEYTLFPTRAIRTSYFEDGGNFSTVLAPTEWDANTVEKFARWVHECVAG